MYLHEAMKDEIVGARHLFRNEVSRIIVEENEKSKSMEELEQKVLQKIKDWIDDERPRWINVDNCWQNYVI